MGSETEPNILHYDEMISAYVKIEDCQRAEYWLQQMIEKRMTPNVQSFSTMIVAFAKCMNTARAVYWLETTAGAGMCCDVTTYEIVLDACIKPNICSYGFLTQEHAQAAG